MDISILEDTGFSKREAKVYMALLELGPSTIGPIVDKTNIPSSKIYEVLNRLEEKGMASHVIIKNQKKFQAADPETILNQMEEKQKKFENHLTSLKKIQAMAEQPIVEYYENSPAIFSMLRQVVNKAKKGDEYLEMTMGEENLIPEVPRFFSSLKVQCKEEELKIKVVAPKDKKEIMEKAYEKEALNIMNIKYTNIIYPQGIIIVNDNLILIEWEGEPSAIRIQSNTFSKVYKKFFNYVYNS